jgi:hypothetical protein
MKEKKQKKEKIQVDYNYQPTTNYDVCKRLLLVNPIRREFASLCCLASV